MTNQNPVIERQIRPDEAMQELGIKSDAYYSRMKFLDQRAAKDKDGKAYISQGQFDQLMALGQHIEATGKMEGFIVSNAVGSSLVTQDESGLMNEAVVGEVEESARMDEGQQEQLIRMAAELKTQRLITIPRIVEAIANQMSEEELPEDLRAVVNQSREAVSSPKVQPAQMAANILNQWRSQQSGNTQQAVA